MPEMAGAGSEATVSASRHRLASEWEVEEPENSALRLFASALIDLALSLMQEAEEVKEEAA